MAITKLQSKEAFNQAIQQNKAVIIDFFAVWCGPCKVLAPLLEIHSEEDKYSSVLFAKIDVDELSFLCDELDIQAMPTVALFKDGIEVEKIIEPDPAGLIGLIEKGLQ
ncbi:putative thioredoxin [Xylariales sp. PMI_506]|nr:putative thioredoxin [Xylariales sp. PMI_506]